MKITILGNNSAIPAYGRHPTAQLVQLHDVGILLDCGEGTQMQLQLYGLPAARITHIFISHAHGDHYFGLAGLISSMSLLGRTKALYIYGPKLVKDALDLQLPWDLGFPLFFTLLPGDSRQTLLSHEKYEVSCFPVFHSIATHGFLVTEKRRKRILLPDRLREHEIPKYFYRKISEGDDYETRDGRVIANSELSLPGLPNKRYAYTADTRYNESIVPDITGVDLLYHEATYLDLHRDRAILRLHSTAKEAAQIALLAGCKKLIIGHFSSKYKQLDEFSVEARSIFPDTELAEEGRAFGI